LFDALGIEIEYMLVDRDTLNVRPLADVVLSSLAGGQPTSEISVGPISWSNELTLHLIELKTSDPAEEVVSLPCQFENAIGDLNPVLQAHHLRLLPTGMHPWMNPVAEPGCGRISITRSTRLTIASLIAAPRAGRMFRAST